MASKKPTITVFDPAVLQPGEYGADFRAVEERWEGGDFDAALVRDDTVVLRLSGVRIPDGDLTGLARRKNLRELWVGGRTATLLDLTGVTQLTGFGVGHVRTLERIIGLETLTELEELMVTSQHQITELPSFAALTNLTYVNLALMRELDSVAPVAEAPNLRYLDISRVGARQEDAQLLRAHPRLLGFSMGGAIGFDGEAFDDVVGRPRVPYHWREEYPGDDATPEVRHLPTEVPERIMEFDVRVYAGTSYGGILPVSRVGSCIMDRRVDWGSSFDTLTVELVVSETGVGEFAESVAQHQQWRESLPEVRVNRHERQARVTVASKLSITQLHKRDPALFPALFAQAVGEVRAALPLLRARLRDGDDFDLDGLITATAALLADRPRTPEELTALFDRIEREDRDRRAAFRAAQD